MDEVDKTEDRRFVRRMERYFTKTAPGQYRTSWIVPSPFFVASDMNYAVQAADVCIYCVNWGFRLDTIGMSAQAGRRLRDDSVRGLVGFSSTGRATATATLSRASESFMCLTPMVQGEAQKKGGNAVGATRKSLLGRASR